MTKIKNSAKPIVCIGLSFHNDSTLCGRKRKDCKELIYIGSSMSWMRKQARMCKKCRHALKLWADWFSKE